MTEKTRKSPEMRGTTVAFGKQQKIALSKQPRYILVYGAIIALCLHTVEQILQSRRRRTPYLVNLCKAYGIMVVEGSLKVSALACQACDLGSIFGYTLLFRGRGVW